MKKLITIFLLTMPFILNSCQKDEALYSCDPAVDKWTKANLSEIQQMTRSNWMEVDEELSIAVYRAFTPLQMQNFWIEKINEVIDLGWNSKEEAHLKKILEYIIDNPKLFNVNKDENLYDDFDKFSYKWIEYAQKELFWDKKLIKAIIADGHRLKNRQGDVVVKSTTNSLLVKSRSEGGTEDRGLSCNCSTDYDWCSGSSEICQDRGCDQSLLDWGCGTLYGHRCTGRCHSVNYE